MQALLGTGTTGAGAAGAGGAAAAAPSAAATAGGLGSAGTLGSLGAAVGNAASALGQGALQFGQGALGTGPGLFGEAAQGGGLLSQIAPYLADLLQGRGIGGQMLSGGLGLGGGGLSGMGGFGGGPGFLGGGLLEDVMSNILQSGPRQQQVVGDDGGMSRMQPNRGFVGGIVGGITQRNQQHLF